MRRPWQAYCLACVAGLAVLAPQAPLFAQVSSEDAVKAAYLTKFAPFITWPANVFASPTAPVTICVLGADPFGPLIDRAAAGSTGGRPLAIRRIAVIDTAQPGAMTGCQIAYISDPLVGLDVLGAMRDRPIVTVTDSGIRTRGIISFVITDNHVRFDIDDEEAERSGVHFSSKLLELAHAVKMKEGAR